MAEKKGAARPFVVVGYELTAFDKAMSLRLTYASHEASPVRQIARRLRFP
jgi:hypothetical protein